MPATVHIAERVLLFRHRGLTMLATVHITVAQRRRLPFLSPSVFCIGMSAPVRAHTRLHTCTHACAVRTRRVKTGAVARLCTHFAAAGQGLIECP